MKRFISVLILCFLVLSTSAQAFVQLAPIAAAAIGASLLTILGSSTTKVAINNNGSFGYDGPDLTVPVAVYNTYMQAGSSIALGYLTSVPYDMAEAYRLGLLQAEPEIVPTLNEILITPGPPPPGAAIVGPGGGHWRISSDWTNYSYRYTWWINQQLANPSLIFPGSSDIFWLSVGSMIARVDWSDKDQTYDAYHVWAAKVVNDEVSPIYTPALPPSITADQSQQISQALASKAAADSDTKDSLEKVVKNNPGLLGQPTVITPEQVQAYAQQAAQSAIDSNISAIQSALANDPSNVALQLQLAAAQAEAARHAAEQVKKQAETPPEPNFPVPNSWYAPKCNKDNLAQCINYQQVIDASHSWANTAIYQIPNLILQCLGFVQGEGCTHPPSLTVDFLNRYTNSPLNIDLSPYVSVVNTIKFFLSILIFVGTGRLVMVLFQ